MVELDAGITVYPAREEGDWWRAVWYENGQRRRCEARTEDRLAARMEKVTERLTADARASGWSPTQGGACTVTGYRPCSHPS